METTISPVPSSHPCRHQSESPADIASEQAADIAGIRTKVPAAKRRRRDAGRLKTIHLWLAIGRELDDCSITTPAEVDVALGMPAVDATKLLTRHQCREGDAALLGAAVDRLGLQVPELELELELEP